MPALPFQLRYELNRAQRLVPHLAAWGAYGLLVSLLLAGAIALAIFSSPWWTLLVLALSWVSRGLFFGLWDVAVRPVRSMEVEVRENGLGFWVGEEKYWIFLDGIMSVGKVRDDIWTIQHHNGTVIHVLASAIREDQIEYIKAGARRYREFRALGSTAAERDSSHSA